MNHVVSMASLGPSVEEAIVHEWLVDVGQAVEAREPILSVETEKSVIEIEADVAGTLVGRLVEVGATVRIGDALAELAK